MPRPLIPVVWRPETTAGIPTMCWPILAMTSIAGAVVTLFTPLTTHFGFVAPIIAVLILGGGQFALFWLLQMRDPYFMSEYLAALEGLLMRRTSCGKKGVIEFSP